MKNQIKYKDFIGDVNFSEEDGVFWGKIIGISASITFEGESVRELTEDFQNAVDEYLEYCKKNGITPQKSYKGSFNIRISPELHKEAAFIAGKAGLSLNAFVEKAIRDEVHSLQQSEHF